MSANKIYIIISLLILIIITSCGLKQPEINPDSEFAVGSVYVNSNIIGARIFVNSDSTGKVTPDTIKNIPLGTAIIEVFKDGYLIDPDSIVVNVNSDSIVTVFFALDYITNQGKLFINSTPAGAKIIVDDNSSGKFTPDTVVVDSGLHHIELYKNGFDSLVIGQIDVATNSLNQFDEILVVEKQVLIESFANSSCLPCTTTDAHLQNFVAAHNERDYALIEYFTSWPNLLDPMYQHNTAGSSARFGRDFYSLTTVPAMFVDGISTDALNYSSITSQFNSQYAVANQDISITLSEQISDSIRVGVELNEFNPLPAGDWRLFIAVIEKHISFPNPPGTNGLSDFSHVFRTFLTANEGDIFSFNNGQFVHTYTGAISPEWDLNEIRIIGFIQDINSKVVLKSSHL